MSDQVVAQLGLAALVLDRVVVPLAMDEVTGRSALDDHPSLRDIRRPDPPLDDLRGSDAAGRQRRPLLLISAAAVLVLAGIAGLAARDPQPGNAPGATGDEPVTTASAGGLAPTVSDSTSSTTDPLSDLNMPPGEMPPDLVQRFTSTLGAFGQLWVYDSASTDLIYFVRRGPADGSQFGYFDRSTYESGQAWGLEGQPGADLLYGLTSPSFPVTVTFGDTTVSSDENGLWYTRAPEDLPDFTITTPSETINVDLVTSAETPQTTTVTIPP